MPHQPSIAPIEFLSNRPAARIDTSLVGLSKKEINKKLADRAKTEKKATVAKAVQKVVYKVGKVKPPEPKYVLRPVQIPPPIEEKPYSETIYTVVPQATEYPTIDLPGKIGGVAYLPWSAAPVGYAIPFLPAALGVLLIKAGGQLLAALAMEVTVGLVELGLTKAKEVQMQLHTGRGAERYPGFTDAVRERATSKDSNSEWERATDWTV